MKKLSRAFTFDELLNRVTMGEKVACVGFSGNEAFVVFEGSTEMHVCPNMDAAEGLFQSSLEEVRESPHAFGDGSLTMASLSRALGS